MFIFLLRSRSNQTHKKFKFQSFLMITTIKIQKNVKIRKIFNSNTDLFNANVKKDVSGLQHSPCNDKRHFGMLFLIISCNFLPFFFNALLQLRICFRRVKVNSVFQYIPEKKSVEDMSGDRASHLIGSRRSIHRSEK